MRVVVAGLGVQGAKRRRIADDAVVATVDPVSPDADVRDLADIPTTDYDAVLACVPDAPKAALIDTCIRHGKHVLVEKPLAVGDAATIDRLEAAARAAGVVVYTAYNHRFEPHVAAMKALLEAGDLGRIYRCRLFYGNGTARLVRDSGWRDTGAGVLPDLGSHLLDMVRFWFGGQRSFRLVSADRFENIAPDHAVFVSEDDGPRIECETTLVAWRNHFTADLFAENGSAHIESLCKWGPTTLTVRRRVLPSGRPSEEATTLVEGDPTWAIEYAYFKRLVETGAATDLSTDRWIHGVLDSLARDVPPAEDRR